MSGCSSSRGVRGTHRFPFAECSLVFPIPAAALWGELLISSPGALLLGQERWENRLGHPWCVRVWAEQAVGWVKHWLVLCAVSALATWPAVIFTPAQHKQVLLPPPSRVFSLAGAGHCWCSVPQQQPQLPWCCTGARLSSWTGF